MSIEIKAIVMVRVPGGWQTFSLAMQDMNEYLKNPKKHEAGFIGMTEDQYDLYMDCDGSVRCSGLTTDGARCKNRITRPALEPAEWLRTSALGGKCQYHGGAVDK